MVRVERGYKIRLDEKEYIEVQEHEDLVVVVINGLGGNYASVYIGDESLNALKQAIVAICVARDARKAEEVANG